MQAKTDAGISGRYVKHVFRAKLCQDSKIKKSLKTITSEILEVKIHFFVRLPVERKAEPDQEVSFKFLLCGAETSSAAPQTGVDQIPDGFTKHVETVDDQRQAKPRLECQPMRLFHEPAPFPAEYPSLTGNLDGQRDQEPNYNCQEAKLKGGRQSI